MNNLQGLRHSGELLQILTWRDIKVRYKQSVMGILWAVLMPSLIVGAGALVRIGAAKYSGTTVTEEDIHSVMVRAVAWAFFIAAVRFGTNSLIVNPNLVTKIAFPKEVFPIASVLSSLFDFLVAAVAVLIVLLATGWRPEAEALLAVPLIFVLIAFTTGLALLLSAANLFFRDVKYLVEIILMYAIFFTPVLYDASVLGKWQTLVMLNPISPLLEALSDVLVEGIPPDWAWLAYSTSMSLLTLVFGYWLFKQLEARFAESI